MKVKDICTIVDLLAPPSLAYEWDRCGLHIGNPEAEVTRVMVALTITEDVLRAAIKKKVQMVVAHHPLIWEPLRSLRTDDPQAALCLGLAQAGIACYSAHTNLDLAPGGVNDTLARLLGLQGTKPLLPARHAGLVKLVTFVPESHLGLVRNAMCEAGAGTIGDYTCCSFSAPGTGTFMPGAKSSPYSGKKGRLNAEPEHRLEVLTPSTVVAGVVAAMKEAHPYEEVAYDVVALKNQDPNVGLGVRGTLPKSMTLKRFAAYVQKALDLQAVRVVGRATGPVRNVGVIGGSGGGEIAHLPSGLDVLVTGDVKYHDALTALERDLAIVDAEHDGTEKCIVPVLAAHLRKHTEGIGVVSHRERGVFSVMTRGSGS